MVDRHHADPKTRILESAERAFAQSGLEAASIRRIAASATVNVASVYYYFHSKEGLIEAVFAHRFGPLKAAHLKLLNQFSAAHGGKALPIEKILQAMFIPPLRLAEANPKNHRTTLQLIGRLVNEPNPVAQKFFNHFFTDVHDAFLEAFQKAVPTMSRTDLNWRIEFIWGSLTFTLCNPEHICEISRGACNAFDGERVMAQLIACFAPCFRVKNRRPGNGHMKPVAAARS